MATTRWLSSLADLETRIRRVLRIAGPIETQLEQPAKVIPVAIAADLTVPGANVGGMSMRRWMSYHESLAPIAEDEFSGSFLQADTSSRGAIIDSVDICRHSSVNLPSDVRVRLMIFAPGLTPNDGSADLTTIRTPLFVEGTQSSSDFAPLGLAYFLSDALPVGGGSFVGLWLTEVPSGTDNQMAARYLIPLNVFLAPGAWIGFVFDPSENADTEAMHWTVTWQGRAF